MLCLRFRSPCLALIVGASSALLPGVGSASAAPPYTALYAFGDSWTLTERSPYWQGRWSNGPMWPEILSTNWGLPYVAENNYSRYFAGGTTSAVFNDQVPMFTGSSNAPTALFVLWAFGNDIGEYVFKSDGTLNSYAFTNAAGWSYLIVRMTRNISNSVVRLHKNGARTILVPDGDELQRCPPPIFNETQQGQISEQVQAYNRMLDRTLAALDASIPNLRILRLNFHDRWNEFLDQALSLGYTVVDRDAISDPALEDKSFTGPGSDYVFWAGAHTTTRVHEVWAKWFDEVATQTRTESLRLVTHNNSFHLELSKLKPGRKYTLETSDNLTAWTTQESFTAGEGTNTLAIAPTAGEPAMRLFRLSWRE